MRRDFQFGGDDLTVYPQWYFRKYPHMCATPHCPFSVSSNSPKALMWWLPKNNEFASISCNGMKGLCKLLPEKLQQLRQHVDHQLADKVHIISPVYHQLSRLSIVKKPGSLSKKGIKESKATPRPVGLTKEMCLTIIEVRLNTIGDWNVFDRRKPSYLIVLTW
jgi:hypothetical protein